MLVRQAAKDYAKDNGVTLQHIMDLIEEKRIDGFHADGYWYVRFDLNIDQATALGQPAAENLRAPSPNASPQEQRPDTDGHPAEKQLEPATSSSDQDRDEAEYASAAPRPTLASNSTNESDPRADSRAEIESPRSGRGKAAPRRISVVGAMLLAYGFGIAVLHLQDQPASQDFLALGNENGFFAISFPIALMMGVFLITVALRLGDLDRKRDAIEQCDGIHPRLSSGQADALVSWQRKHWIKGSVNNLLGLSIGLALGATIVQLLGVASWSHAEATVTTSVPLMLAYAVSLLGVIFSIVGFVVPNDTQVLLRATALFAMGIIAALIVFTSLRTAFELDLLAVVACLPVLFLFWYAAYMATTRFGRLFMWRDIEQASEETELAALQAARRCVEDPVSLKGSSLKLDEHKAFFKIPLLRKAYVCLMREKTVVMIAEEMEDLRILDRMDFELAGLYGVPIEPANKIVRSDEWIQSIYWEFDDESLQVYRSWSNYRKTTSPSASVNC